MHYRIEFYSDLWKDWVYFDEKIYKVKEQAQSRIDEYKSHKTGLELRTTQITIINERPKRVSRKDMGTKITVEKA